MLNRNILQAMRSVSKKKAKLRIKVNTDHAIWHENKSGNVTSYPYSCALRAGASYNYLLVDGVRRLTPREMLRLQGFPDTFKIVCSDSQTRKQAGNAVPVPMIEAVIQEVLSAKTKTERRQIQNRDGTISIRGIPQGNSLRDKQVAYIILPLGNQI